MVKAEEVVLLLIDLQEPILARSKTNPPEAIRKAASVLARAAKILDIPVVVSAVPQPTNRLQLLDALPGPALLRSRPGALEDGPTLAAIKATGRKRIVIGGVLTEVAAYSAAVGAREQGFDVTLLIDACGGASPRTEAATIETLRADGVRILSVASFLASLITDFGEEPGKSLLPLMRETYA